MTENDYNGCNIMTSHAEATYHLHLLKNKDNWLAIATAYKPADAVFFPVKGHVIDYLISDCSEKIELDNISRVCDFFHEVIRDTIPYKAVVESLLAHFEITFPLTE